nr:zinc ribbon domain-containing protein [Altererythrobacter sp. KTW20L]
MSELLPCVRLAPRPKWRRTRSSRNNTLTGLAKCGMPGCGAGMTLGSGTSRSKQKYYYYKCNERTNIGQRCKCPNVRREKLDEVVLRAIEKRILGPGRLEQLLSDVIELSDGKRGKLEQELSQTCAERTRRRNAIDRLLVLIEEGVMKPSDPEFASRLAALSATRASRVNGPEAPYSDEHYVPELIASELAFLGVPGMALTAEIGRLVGASA